MLPQAKAAEEAAPVDGEPLSADMLRRSSIGYFGWTSNLGEERATLERSLSKVDPKCPRRSREQSRQISLDSLWQLLDHDGSGMLGEEGRDLAKLLLLNAAQNGDSNTQASAIETALHKSQGNRDAATSEQFARLFKDDKNGSLQDDVLAEIQSITSTWYTATVWPRVKVSYSCLFLPLIHTVFAICCSLAYSMPDVQAHGLYLRMLDHIMQALTSILPQQYTLQVSELDVHARKLRIPGDLEDYIFYAALLPMFAALVGSLRSWYRESSKGASTLESLFDGVRRDANTDAFRFFDVENSYIARLLRPIAYMHKPWQFTVVGVAYLVALFLCQVAEEDTGAADDSEVFFGVLLMQYWAYCIVGIITSLSSAWQLAPQLYYSWKMDYHVLSCYKFTPTHGLDVPQATAKDVYQWLLSTRVPTIDVELANLFWDSVKRRFFTPSVCSYGIMPVAAALWLSRTLPVHLVVHNTSLALLVMIPNVVVSFVFQSFMIAAAAIVRRKLRTTKGMTHMLSPLNALVVGLPTVTLASPKTLVAWLKLQQFVHTSFEVPSMVYAEFGFSATLGLLIILQVALFLAVSGERWALAAFLFKFYFVCLVYGSGTLVVALNLRAEYKKQMIALERLRINHITDCYLNWGPRHKHLSRSEARSTTLQFAEVIKWCREQENKQQSGLQASRPFLAILRTFMLVFSLATIAKLPIILQLWEHVSASPLFAQLAQLQKFAGPLLGMLP